MIKKLIISIVPVSLVFFVTSCGPKVEVPGDISVKSVPKEMVDSPGNISAYGRVKASGR